MIARRQQQQHGGGRPRDDGDVSEDDIKGADFADL